MTCFRRGPGVQLVSLYRKLKSEPFPLRNPNLSSCTPQTRGYQTKKTTRLKEMMQSKHVEFLMEAHSGLSAKIAEEAGFKGIWGSGLSIAAQLGVRDCNEISWTQVLDVADYMVDATTIPILLDIDTGFGNFNNARRVVRKLEQMGIAGCCIEDKIFPKNNSLLSGRKQPLADVREFALKIRACKDTQSDPDFVVVARVEALIAGWGLKEAMKRAEAYMEAGADAILMHSKLISEIEGFMEQWKDRAPVLIVPTFYYQTPYHHFEKMGVSTVVWANYNLRASITAMQEISAKVFKDRSVCLVEDTIAPVSEVFRLQDEDELAAAEDKYLPCSSPS